MKTLLLTIFTMAGLSAQTFVAPSGSLHCRNKIDHQTAVDHGCKMTGFVGPTGTGTFMPHKAKNGTFNFVFFLSPGGEVIEGNGSWGPVIGPPPSGVRVIYSFLSETSTGKVFLIQGAWAWKPVENHCGKFMSWTNISPVTVSLE